MKKHRNRPPQKSRTKTTPQPAPVNRRGFLGTGLIVAAGVAGGGFFMVNSVMAAMAEQDMTKVGQGTPAIVQIHDPNCPQCQDLQRETRAALETFDAPDLVYLVANIKSTDGLAFANQYGAAHVTLLLFDGAGQLRSTLNGVRPRAELQTAFAALIAAET